MSLLNTSLKEEFIEIAKKIIEKQISQQDQYHIEFTKEQQQIMLEGTVNHLLYLRLAVTLNEDKVYLYYVDWIYALLSNHMGFMGEETIKSYLTDHYQYMFYYMDDVFDDDKSLHAKTLLTQAIQTTLDGNAEIFRKDYIHVGGYIENKQMLLHHLLEKDTLTAGMYVKELFRSIPLEELYTDVIQDVMREVGELWHQNKISVAQEHYCTAATQTIMSQFYEILLQHPRRGKKVVIACPGTELHELGARILSDLFEHNGWDSIFLGAAVPVQDIIDVIETDSPQLCCLSVCMPQGLPLCFSAVKQIKEQFPKLIVSVGGRAFHDMENVAEKMGADIYSETFPQLLRKMRALGT